MKHFLFLLLITFMILPAASAQLCEDTTVYREADQKPKPPADYRTVIQQQLRYPEPAKKNKYSGRVMLAFIVECDGSISNITPEGSINDENQASLATESIRVIRLLGPFTPAVNNGQPVRFLYRFPLDFRIE
ncbi:MAG: hypothetical protein BGO09_09200 [Bacteroidetes bacterium 47-18]|nr:MAG: hypothetical protein BGO09_09200 [Bacteroidetes bacterium 47-18]